MRLKEWLLGVVGIVMILVCMGILAGGCEKWQTATVSYEAAGEGLDAFRVVAQDLCEQGALNGDTCVKLKGIYNKSREIYINAGDVMVAAMRLDDAAARDVKMKDYHDLMGKISDCVREAVDLLKSSGIGSDKIDAILKKFVG